MTYIHIITSVYLSQFHLLVNIMKLLTNEKASPTHLNLHRLQTGRAS